MQGWQYGKGLIYLRPIFRPTKLAFLRATATLKTNAITAPEIEIEILKLNLNLNSHLNLAIERCAPSSPQNHN